MKLQGRFSVTITLLIVFLSAGFVGSLYIVEKRHLVAQSQRGHLEALDHLSTVSRESLLSKDEIPLYNYMRQLSQSPGVKSAMFVDPSERILMHTDLRLKDTFLKSADDPASLIYRMPVELDGHVVGSARLDYDRRLVEDQIASTLSGAVKRFTAVSVMCLLLGMAFAQAAAYRLARPIRRLVDGARRISEGDFSAKIPEGSQDEIGELSREFNQMSRRLGELDELKEEFLRTVSHDLRNPLFAISMSTEYLMDANALDDAQREKIGIIRRSAQNLSSMVTDILDASKIKAGKMEYDRMPISAADLLSDPAALFDLAAKRQGILFSLDLPAKTVILNVDKGMIHRVLSNLLSNALKFSRQGGSITLGLGAEEERMQILYVADTGVGVAEEHLPKIFERFYQVSRPGEPTRIGTGLGLSIAKTIIEGHGGRIWVESRRGEGTTFRFTLPCAEAP
jgi:signal transduction histidine kinase